MCVLARGEKISILSWHNRYNKEDVTAENATGGGWAVPSRDVSHCVGTKLTNAAEVKS